MFYITYEALGRTGNNILQYLTCKLFQCILKNHIYTEDVNKVICENYIIFNDDMYSEICMTPSYINKYKDKNILCRGYFQKDNLLNLYRKDLLSLLKESDDLFNHYTTYNDSCYRKF